MRADTGKSVPVLKEFRVETILAPVTPEKPALPNGQAQSIQEADQAVGWAPQYKRPTRLSESTSSSSDSIHNDRLFASRNSMVKETDTIAHCGGMSFSDLLALNHGLAATPMRYNNHTSNGFLPSLVPQSPSTAFTSENQARMGLLGRSYKTVVDLQGSNQRTEIQQNAVNAVPNGDDIMMNAFTLGHGPIPVFAPATPDHCKRLQGKVAPAKTIFVADIHPNKQNGEDSQVSTIDDVLGMKRTKSATESIAIESYDPNLDLNKTSQQKPRRKKHRPKVVSEAKPKQTPKQRTPKPTDASETPRQMRTYVRRNKPKIPTATPPESGVEALDCKIPGPAVKSCKKALNFTLEDQLREKNFHRSTNTPPLEKLPQDLYPRIEKDFMMKATREYSAYKHEFTAISSQKGDSTEAMDPRDHLACSPYYSTRANSNRGKHKSGLKRAKCSADYMFLGNAIFSCSHGLYFPKIHKKRRTEKVLKPNTAIILSFTKALESIRAARSSLNYRREAHYFPEIRKKRRTEKVLKLNTSCILSFTHALEHIRAATGLQDYQREAAKTSKYYPILLPDLNISVEANSQASGALGHEDRTQFIKWGDINELNKRFMARTCVRELDSQEGFKECKTSRSRAKGGVKGTGKKNVNEVYISCMEARHKVINAKQHRRKPRKKNSAAKSATSSFSMVLYDDHHPIGNPKGPLLTLPWINANSTDVDAIIEGMKHLSINRDGRIVPYQEENTLMPYHDQDQQINALVLYQRDGVIIPFEGTSKRLERAKVDLDDETNRVWNLLLEDINNQGIDGTDEDKTKWWQEERNVFRGRVDSFIARMRLVQGDRRFSPWKGSVVDSVVGVFLTQNVSDHLSSSAYMSLAARYPPKSENNVRTDSEEEIDPSGKELEICTVELDENSDNLELSGKAVEGHICDRNSGTLNDTNVCEEKVVNFKESQGNTNLKDNAWCLSQGKPHESQLCKETSLKELDITLTVDDSTLNDVTSSHHSVIVQNSIESPSLPTSGMGLQSDNSSEAEDLTESSASFVEILKLAETPMLHATYTPINKVASCQSALLDQEEIIRYDKPSQKAFREENDSFSNVPCNRSTTYQLLPVDEYHSHSVDEESIYVNSTSLVNTTTESAIEFHLHSKASKSNLGSSSPGVDMVIQSPRLPAIEQLNTISTLTEESSSPQKNIQLPTVLNETIPTERTCELTPTLPLSDSKYSSGETHKVLKQGASKRKKLRNPKKISYDWDSLRTLAQANVGRTRQRTANTMDSLDWEAVRCADVHEIAETIRDRGMNNMLAERIKEFLDRLMKDHGSIDLEWLREVPPDQAKEYLLSIRGLGLKSVECVRLLTLHHLAFPVDTNVGRIAVRLGWVPLQPLPESLQLHLLELYPVLESIQKYLWPRLCKLDQRTLYELHYHMITFGKVFCTKRQPNCNACPLRGECRHFASAFASARLALPGPQDRSIILSDRSNLTHQNPQVTINSLPMPLLMADHTLSTKSQVRNCEPIVEIPASPEQEPEQIQTLECDMEDIFSEDPNEIPTIKLNMEEFTQTLQAYMQSNKELQEGDMSKALVALAAEAAFIPTPKLKNVSRLRTEHHVYELPDTHHLLRGLDKREPDDPCPYLLAIWSPGETANSIEQPQKRCNLQEPGHLCSDETCFYCNSLREADSQIVRGTLLIPCRTAMRGSFPLNGTYFQVNEVFADQDSSLDPIQVPRASLWNLPRRTVYFGTSIPTIFKGLSTEGIQHCFWRGYVCLRGFDQKTRAPRPLMARLHFPASKSRARGKSSEQPL